MPRVPDPGGGSGGGAASGGGISLPAQGVTLDTPIELLASGALHSHVYPQQNRIELQVAPLSSPLHAPGAASIWAAMPAGLTEFLGLTIARVKADLSSASQARLSARVTVAGFAGAVLAAQYSTDETNWTYCDAVSGPSATITTASTVAGSWVTLDPSANADMFLRLVGSGGNGVVSPQFGAVVLEVK